MYMVHYFENKNLIVSHLVKTVPNVDQEIKLKGRKGKVLKVSNVDDRNIQVQVELEAKNKSKLLIDNSKKKKR